MNIELMAVKKALEGANYAEDVFGNLIGDSKEKEKQVKRLYREIAKKIHPDYYPEDEKAEANSLLQMLILWRQDAQEKIANNNYGKADKVGKDGFIETKKYFYRIIKLLKVGDLTDVYLAEYFDETKKKQKAAIKIAACDEDNDFIRAEANTLKNLIIAARGKYKIFARYLPTQIDSFVIRDENRKRTYGNIFKLYEDYYSLGDVIAAYPEGINIRAMAWMWNRVLEILGFIHRQKIVHGGIIPDHLLIHPVYHGVKLIDWTTAVSAGKIKLMSKSSEGYYAPEIFSREDAKSATDIYMSARCMIRLLGGKTVENLTHQVPDSVKRILKVCTVSDVNKRPQDAWVVRDEFDDILEKLYGKRSYCEFKMPSIK